MSREMHDLVTPYLYRQVVLPYGNAAGLGILHCLLQSKQCPLARSIKLIKESPSNSSQSYLDLTVKELLSRLPDDSLTRLEWDDAATVNVELVGTLWQHHRGLQYFRLSSAKIHNTSRSVASRWIDLQSLGSVTHLDLMLRYPNDMWAVSEVLKYLRLSQLKKLTLEFQREEWQLPFETRQTFPNPLFSDTLPSTLASLPLGRMDLSASDRWSRVTWNHGLH